ncbi:MAG TPA: ABC transporter ATP-binding protein, partial [Kofleriaceae bacterium]|nr:ABC transporter ATP-binding protein [Kofleriaceae bacterium]
LDEPLGALDLKLREQMQVELKGLQRRLGITFIYVTHDQGEALSMSDRVAVFNHGRVEQCDPPAVLYARPRTPFVAGFVGTANVLSAAELGALAGAALAGAPIDHPVSIRPEHIAFAAARPDDGELGCAGEVIDVQFHGPTSRFEVQAAGARLIVSVANRGATARPAVGDRVELAWPRDAMIALEAPA